MKAAVVEAFGTPLVLREWDTPPLGASQILVKAEACGVCHTDLHAARGDWPVKPSPPFIPGHEGVGLVAAVGSGVTNVKEGDRVGVPWLNLACGHCEHCLAVWETVCGSAQFGDYTVNGGFADYVLADPSYVARIPDGLSAVDAAPLICAGVTTYKGIKEAATKPGDWVVASGAGGLGHLAIQYAKAMGLHVCAVDIDAGKLAHALLMGADVTVNARLPDAVEQVKKATAGGAHGVLIKAPSVAAFKQGVAMTRKRGTCVLTGLSPPSFPSRCLTWCSTASRCVARWWVSGKTWPRLWLLPPKARSRPALNGNHCQPSIRYLTDVSVVGWRQGLYWILVKPE